MALPVLLALVVGGIGFLGLMLHALGHSRGFDLRDASVARAEWQRHWPEDVVHHVYMGDAVALVDTDAGPGLLRPFGADTVAHRIHQINPAPQGLRIGFGAFEAPPVQVALSPEKSALWVKVWQGAQNG